MRAPPWRLATALALGGAGCAAVNPNLMPARVLTAGQTVVNAGVAYAAPVGDGTLRDADTAQQNLAQGAPAQGDDERFRRAAAAWGNASAGVASVLSVHRGFGNGVDAHVALLGPRILRVGVRRALWTDATERWSLTSAFALRGGYQPLRLPGPAGNTLVGDSGLAGADAGLALGRTVSRIYDLWFAARVGYLYGMGGVRDGAWGSSAWTAQLHRVDAGLALGIHVGFGRVGATFEIEGAFAWYSATGSNGTSAQGPLFALTPAAAVGFWF